MPRPEPSMLQGVTKDSVLDGGDTMTPARSLRESSEPTDPQSWPGPGGPHGPSAQSASLTQRPGAVVETDIPARLDCLPWGRFHTLVVAGLGITWILDGLEVTLASAFVAALKGSST